MYNQPSTLAAFNYLDIVVKKFCCSASSSTLLFRCYITTYNDELLASSAFRAPICCVCVLCSLGAVAHDMTLCLTFHNLRSMVKTPSSSTEFCVLLCGITIWAICVAIFGDMTVISTVLSKLRTMRYIIIVSVRCAQSSIASERASLKFRWRCL